jgi:hypothetical protein
MIFLIIDNTQEIGHCIVIPLTATVFDRLALHNCQAFRVPYPVTGVSLEIRDEVHRFGPGSKDLLSR